MPPSTYIKALDLETWANQLISQSTLPQLIRRLIQTTLKGPSKVDFPSGEGIQLSGWDGIVITEQGNSFVPKGISAWELGTDKDPKGKADKDYQKRCVDPLGIDPCNSTFIFVTPRRWSKKGKWIQERKSEKKWLDVIAYDANDIEQWLEIAPSVHIWISVLLGKQVEDAIDLNNYWKEWKNSIKYNIPPEFILSGRQDNEQLIQNWIEKPLQPLVLQADTKEEALLVFSASIQKLNENIRDLVCNRTLIIYDQTSWRRIASSENPLILIPMFDDNGSYSLALDNKHQIMIPRGRSDQVSKDAIRISRLSSSEAKNCLVNNKFSEEIAQELATLAHRSFKSFIREVAIIPEEHTPDWAQPQNARALLPFLLVGQWDVTKEGDKRTLERLANLSYDEINTVVMRWMNEDDPPLKMVGNICNFVSKRDGWLFLSRYSSIDDFQRFTEITIEILSSPNPVFDLPIENRWAPSIYGSLPQYSDAIRRGIADTLALIGALSINSQLSISLDLQIFLSTIVTKILEKANGDWRIWASLSNVLPLLAEAAPDAFLEAIDVGLKENPPVLKSLFLLTDGVFASSPHVGLLWALETLAWDPQILARVSIALVKLSQIDPGVKSENKPINTLKTIFLIWYPQTTAPSKTRLSIIDIIRKTDAETAWLLMKSILPNMHGVSWPIARPHWRKWDENFIESVTIAEIIDQSNEIINKLCLDVGFNGSRWKDIIETLPTIPIKKYQEIYEKLSELPVELFNPSDALIVWNALRSLISSHRSFPDADWALPQELIDQLVPIYNKFEPTNDFDKYEWLFNYFPELIEGKEEDFENYQIIITKNQREAISRIIENHGINAVLDFLTRVEAPDVVGKVLGGTDYCRNDGTEDRLLMDCLGNTEIFSRFILGFNSERINKFGKEWAIEKYFNQGINWLPKQRGVFLSCLPACRDTWEIARAYDAETEHEYWMLINPYQIKNEDCKYAVTCLLKYDRPYTAATLITLLNKKELTIPPEMIEAVLNKIMRTSPKDDPTIPDIGYILMDLLDLLYRSEIIDEERIAYFEWNLMPIIGRYNRHPRVLHRKLSRDPGFFIEMVSCIYPAEGEEPHNLSEEEELRARYSTELLFSWRIVPGINEDRRIDAIILSEWVHAAREKLKEVGRLQVGDILIGQMLSGSQMDPDGVWPQTSICDLIEELGSIDIENGIIQGQINSRGVTTRSLGDGGKQEHELANKYIRLSEAIGDRWPRTAAMLRRLSGSYKEYAKHYDLEDEFREELR
jgi:hypothetical protein